MTIDFDAAMLWIQWLLSVGVLLVVAAVGVAVAFAMVRAALAELVARARAVWEGWKVGARGLCGGAGMRKLSYVIAAVILFAAGFGLGATITPSPRVASVQSVYGCPAWVTVTRSSALTRWTLTDCAYQDESQSGGNHNLYFTAVTPFGAPATVYAHQAWADGDVQQLTLGGQTNFGLYGGSFDPQRGEVGAYSGYIESRASSDVVSGMGLPLNRHVNFILTFQQVTPASQPTPTLGAPTSVPGAPTATPASGDYVTHGEFRDLLVKTLIDVLTKGR